MPPDEVGVKNLNMNPPSKRGAHYVKHSMTWRFSDYQESPTELPMEQIFPHIERKESKDTLVALFVPVRQAGLCVTTDGRGLFACSY